MENTAIILIIVTNLMLVLILGTLGFLIYRLLKNQHKPEILPPAASIPEKVVSEQVAATATVEDKYHPAILERIKELQKIKPKRADLFCPIHTNEPGEANCAICDKLYCKACIRPFKSLHFCREHMELIMRHDWDEVATVKTSTQDPEEGVRLYDLKKDLFEQEDLPTYVETHYKINVDHDYIETYLVVFGIREKVDNLKTKFSQFIHEPQ